VLADPEVITKLAANGGFVRHSTPEEVVTFVQSEQKTWRRSWNRWQRRRRSSALTLSPLSS